MSGGSSIAVDARSRTGPNTLQTRAYASDAEQIGRDAVQSRPEAVRDAVPDAVCRRREDRALTRPTL